MNRAALMLTAVLAGAGCASAGPITAPLRYAATPPMLEDPGRATPPAPDASAGEPRLATQSFALENGLRVVVIERHYVPLVVTRLVVDRGVLEMPRAKPYTLQLAVAAALRGTATRDRFQLEDDLAAIGASPDWNADVDGAWIGVESPATTADRAIELIADVARRATFPAVEMRTIKDAWLERLRGSRMVPVLDNNGEIQVFGAAHPYATPSGNEVEAIDALDRDAILTTYGALMRPAHATLVVVGDTVRADVEASARRWFGEWSASGALPTGAAPGAAETTSRVVHVEANDLRTHAAVLAAGPAARSSDALAMRALLESLGGLRSTPLRDTLRASEAHDDAFRARLTEHREASYISIGGSFVREQALDSMRSSLSAIERMRDVGPTASEVETAQRALLASWRESLASSPAIASLLTRSILLRRGLDDVVATPERIHALTAADLMRAARTYLAPASLRVVVVGQASPGALERLGLGAAAERTYFGDPPK